MRIGNQNRLAERAESEGWNGAQLAAAQANFTSQSAAARVAATRETNVQSAIEEAKNTFPLAEEASDALPRSNFVPWNKAVQMVQAGIKLFIFPEPSADALSRWSEAFEKTKKYLAECKLPWIEVKL